MRFINLLCRTAAAFCLIAGSTFGQDAAPKPASPTSNAADAIPILRLEAGGPTSFVSSLAFNPKTGTLYSGSWDKVVRAWEPAAQGFTLDSAATYRVPIGPGINGSVNAVAVSPDGIWLAVGGKGMARGSSDLQHPGLIVSTASMTPEACLDEGTIYLFNVNTREVKTLRGHTAPVFALAFAPAYRGKPLVLLSIGQERKTGEAKINTAAIRAWDALRAVQLGSQILPNVETLGRPGIAAWHTGAMPNQLGVAIACGDGQLRLWNVDVKDQRQALRLAEDGPARGSYNNTAAWWPEKSRLVTGSVGRIKIWRVTAPPVADAIRLPSDKYVPQALALFSSTAKGPTDRAAVAVKFKANPTAPEMVRLLVVDLNAKAVVPNAEIPLWDGTGITPSLAASPGNRRVAAAGNDKHQVVTFAVDDLIAGRGNPIVLQGKGVEPRSANFVKKAEGLGVLVSRRGKPAPGAAPGAPAADDLIFDPKLRRVSNDVAGWELAQPVMGNWRVEVSGIAERAPLVAVFEGNRAVGQIKVDPEYRLTDCALLPPQAPGGVPILAVATHKQRQPQLQLFNAASGEPVRELSGHEYTIESVAFSDDGKLLVSAGGDQTVCIWNLADLDSVVGMRGELRDVELQESGTSLVVVNTKPGGPNSTGQIAIGDALVGWARDNDVQPIGSLLDFYRQVSRSKPKDVISLRRQRQGRPVDTVQLALGQGIDERKPLVTLFVTQDQPWNWIGWSPLGPYESSSEAVEKLLGWHFNTTGSPIAPTRFALAAEYQKLRREGLVEHLLRHRALPVAPPPPLERPSMSIRLNQSSPGYEVQIAEGDSPLRLVGREAELDLELRGLQADQVGRVTWSLDDGEPHRLEPISQLVWAGKLSDLPLERCDPRHIRLVVTTSEVRPQTFSEQVSVVYQPLAPAFDQVAPEKELTAVSEKAFSLQARARSRVSQTADFDVSITLNGAPVAKQTYKGQGAINQTLTLQPGDNTVRMTARNADAKACEDETVLVRRITYSPAMAPPPELALKAFAPGGDRQDLGSHEANVLVVDTPTIHLEGQISAEKPLLRAGWTLGAAQERPCAGFAQNTGAKIDVREQITLEPGPQTLRCTAQAENSVPREVSLTVDYRPRLPELLIDRPPSTDLFEGRDPRRITLTGHLMLAEKQQPFEAIVLLNGQPIGKPLAIQGETFSTDVDLGNGESRIEVQLSNAWNAKTTSAPVWVRYLRPPRIVALAPVPQQIDGPLVDVEFAVESPAELALTELRINDWNLPIEAAVVDVPGPNTTRWKVSVRDVPLQLGLNVIRPLAANSDGMSIDTQTANVNVMLPPPPKAEIEFISLADRTVEPQADVKLIVRSQSRLKRVELHNGSQRFTVNVAKQAIEPQVAGTPRMWRLEVAERIQLGDGVNPLEAVAVNEGGERMEQRNVTYVRPPVQVVIDHLELPGRPSKVLTPVRQEGGKAVFAEAAPDGNLWLHGRVRWPDAASRKPDQVVEAQVFVNGFLQPSVQLKPDGARANELEWAWKVKIRLNHEQQNEVSVRLIGVAQLADSRLDFRVNCEKPDKRQRLHLLVVGVGEENQTLEKLALDAVQGERTKEDQITAPAFSKGWIYIRNSSFVDPQFVMGQLGRIKHNVGDRNSVNAGSDVVMVYFRGPETVDNQGHLCLLTSSRQLSSAIKEGPLLEQFREIPGAQLFLLDVQREIPKGSNGGFRWQGGSQTAVLRYIWVSGGAFAVGAPPKDARLLDAVRNAAPRSTHLGEFENEVSLNSRRVRQKYPENFNDELLVPAALRKLVLVERNP